MAALENQAPTVHVKASARAAAATDREEDVADPFDVREIFGTYAFNPPPLPPRLPRFLFFFSFSRTPRPSHSHVLRQGAGMG